MRVDDKHNAAAMCCKLAGVYSQQKDPFNAALQYQCAGNIQASLSDDKALQSFRLAHDLFIGGNNAKQAAGVHQRLGEYFKRTDRVEESVEVYLAAASEFETCGQLSMADRCRIEAAEALSLIGEAKRAIGLYDAVIKRSMDDTLLRFTTNRHIYMAMLCHACVCRPEGLQARFRGYCDECVSFETSRECKFIQKLLSAMQMKDVEQFTNAVIEFDRVLRINPTETALLLRIKGAIVQKNDSVV